MPSLPAQAGASQWDLVASSHHPQITHVPLSLRHSRKGQRDGRASFFLSVPGLLKPLPHLLSPTCAGGLSQQLKAPALAGPKSKKVEPGPSSVHPPPNFQLPLQLPPPAPGPLGRPLPLSCLLAQHSVSALKTRLGTGGRGEDPKRGSGI